MSKFRLPWKLHGLRRGPAQNMLIEIEHTHLLVLYQRSIRVLDRDIVVAAEAGATASVNYRKLIHDREHAAKMIAWLEGLEV